MTAVPPPDDAAKAGRQLEAFFLRRLLAEARPEGGGGLDSGFAGDTFKQMLDEAIADKMAASGGIGLGAMFATQLGGKHDAHAMHALQGTHAMGPAPTAMPAAMPMPAAHANEPAHITAAAARAIDELPASPSGFVLPVHARQSSGYGPRINPLTGKEQVHPGLDLAANAGTPVAAAAEGTVTHAGPAGTYGNLVTIKHANGLETRYAHLSAVTVVVGAHVEPGQQVGNVGSTGASTGPHLHFEVRRDGTLQDPARFLPLYNSANRASR